MIEYEQYLYYFGLLNYKNEKNLFSIFIITAN